MLCVGPCEGLGPESLWRESSRKHKPSQWGLCGVAGLAVLFLSLALLLCTADTSLTGCWWLSVGCCV